MDNDENQISVKVVLLGESGVGKTSIISQYISNKFNPKCHTSVSAQFISKTKEFKKYSKFIKFDIWDTVGQERYRSLAKIFYKDARIIIFVYDITNEFSFTSIKDFWYKETSENTENDTIYALVGNKVDLYQDAQVKTSEGEEYADEIGAIFQNTSALNNSGIDKLFENLGEKIFNPEFDYKNPEKEIKNNNINKKNNKHNIKLANDNKNDNTSKKCC